MEKDKFYGIVHPTFTLPTLENVKDGDIVPITIKVKDFKGIGSMTCNILFDPLVLGPVTPVSLGSGDCYSIGDPGTPPTGIPEAVWKSYLDHRDSSWTRTGVAAHLDKDTTGKQLTFNVNPEIHCTGFDMGILSANDDPINDPGLRERMGIKGKGDIGKIVFGMYSVPEVAMEDGTLVTIYLKYTNKFKNYTNIQFAWIPGFVYPYPTPTQEQPQLLITDYQNDTIPTSKLLLDDNGDPILEKIETPYYDKKTDEYKIWISYKAKYEEGVDYENFYIDGRIGPLKEKPAFLSGTAVVNGKIVYGTTTTVLPFSKIIAIRESDGYVYRSTTDNTGKFEFSLPYDRYKFRVIAGSQGIDWILGDEADYELAKAYRGGLIPIPDNKRWMLMSCGDDQSVDELRKMIRNINYCSPARGYRGTWWSCTDPSTWPKPWDSFDWDNEEINAQGLYKSQKPKSRDGFIGETEIFNVTKSFTHNFGMVMISDIQGNALTVKKKVRCKNIISKVISTGTENTTVKVQCPNNALVGSEYCASCLKIITP